MDWIFSEDGTFVERECLLFEAGEYPDKGVTLSEEDLQEIAARSEAEIPVKIEHLPESPFDGALGVVTRLRAIGKQLWGTLRQPIEAWRLVQRAGARALSVGLDVAGRRLVETSFVCHPRVASAQVFRGDWNRKDAEDAKERQREIQNHRGAETQRKHREEPREEGREREGGLVSFVREDVCFEAKGGQERMSSVRQFAEGLMAYLRGVIGREEDGEVLPAEFAKERERLAQERAQLQQERVQQQVMEWKRQGRLRATERVEALAQALLLNGEGATVLFDGKSASLRALFAEFVQANGPVVPTGEWLATDRNAPRGGGSARERLTLMAQEKSCKEGLSYVQAFAAVASANPELAQQAREE